VLGLGRQGVLGKVLEELLPLLDRQVERAVVLKIGRVGIDGLGFGGGFLGRGAGCQKQNQ
jgi:hypothetical protein